MTLPALVLPTLPKIEDKHLAELALTHRSYLVTRGKLPVGFLEDYEKLALLGEQALRFKVMALVNGLLSKDSADMVKRVTNILCSPTTLCLISHSYTLPKSVLCRPDIRKALAFTTTIPSDLFCAHIGALLFDGQEKGPLAKRKWDRPAVNAKLDGFVRDLFEQLVGWATKKSEEALVERRPASHPAPQPSPAPSAFSNLSRNSTNSIKLFDSILNEYLQCTALTASFIDVRCGGADHMPLFKVDCVMGGRVVGSGLGKSKKDAKKEACRVALEWLGVDI